MKMLSEGGHYYRMRPQMSYSPRTTYLDALELTLADQQQPAIRSPGSSALC